MNIFILHSDPVVAAQMLCDKHCNKMLLESIQMLSTAHRVLDGQLYYEKGKRKIKRWRLNDNRESILYKATHVNHPANVWIRTSSANYIWLLNHTIALCKEFEYRREKTHKSSELIPFLEKLPNNIKNGNQTPFVLTMPEKYHQNDAIEAYRQFYIHEKAYFAKWTKRNVPKWFIL